MRHEPVTIRVPAGLDWKGVGYLFSIAGTLALGAIACFAPHAPFWYFPTLLIGVVTTIAGFIIRYIAHLREKRQMRTTRAEAEKR